MQLSRNDFSYAPNVLLYIDLRPESQNRLLGDIGLVHLLFVRPKAALAVVWQSRGIIERAGVQPDSVRLERPGRLHRPRQQVLAQPAAEELGKQAEVRDLERAVGVALQLEVARGRSLHAQQPERNRGIREARPDLLVAPRKTIHPMVGAAYFHVQVTEERGGALEHAVEGDVRIVEPRDHELVGTQHLEIGPGDRHLGHEASLLRRSGTGEAPVRARPPAGPDAPAGPTPLGSGGPSEA